MVESPVIDGASIVRVAPVASRGAILSRWAGHAPNGPARTNPPFEGNPFIEDLIDWMGSSEGQDTIEALDLVFDALEKVAVDARRRRIVWPDGKRLSIEQSAARLHAGHPRVSRDLIETHVFGWLENGAPEAYTDEQMEEFDRLMQPWLGAYERKRWVGGK